MPSARTASALRRLVSAITWRSATLAGEVVHRPAAARLGVEGQRDDDDAADDRRASRATGWMMKQPTKKIGMNGMSNSAVGPMPERKPRIWSRSRIGCRLSDCLAPLSGSVATRSKTRGDEQLVEPGADAGQHLGADAVEGALQDVGREHDERDADQGRDAAARQHPVVDLQHVDRAGQHQDVDDRRRRPRRRRTPSGRPSEPRRLPRFGPLDDVRFIVRPIMRGPPCRPAWSSCANRPRKSILRRNRQSGNRPDRTGILCRESGCARPGTASGSRRSRNSGSPQPIRSYVIASFRSRCNLFRLRMWLGRHERLMIFRPGWSGIGRTNFRGLR